MTDSQTGKTVALVTAGGKGLGAEIARTLAQGGANVAVTYLNDQTAADRLVAELKELGAEARAYRADAGDYAAAHDVTRRVVEDLGGLHNLVCCAALTRSGALHRISEADWDDVLRVTLKGTFNYVQAVSRVFIEQRYGKIVCVGSINGLRGRVGTISYNAAKSGLIGLVKTAAAELGQYEVNVNLIAPGFLDTTTQTSTPELIKNIVLNECAIKRLGTPADIAPLVRFLLSDSARHITGQIIKIDAGQYL